METINKNRVINAFGIRFDCYTVDEFVTLITEAIESGKRKMQMTGVNLEQIALLKNNKSFSLYCNSSDFVNIDGIFCSFFLKLIGHKNKAGRVLCADVLFRLLEYANTNHESVYFLGATQESIENLVSNIKILYPNINICGFHNGFFSDDSLIVSEIKKLHPTFLFLGMPSPMKEQFIYEHKEELDAGFSYGVGGMFDILAGKAKRAPEVWQSMGIEWLYRILQNPHGHSKRVLKAIGPGLYVVLKEIKYRFNCNKEF